MRKSIAVLLLLVSTLVSAQESGFTLSTALVGMSMDYREYDDGNTILDSEKSNFNEIGGGDFSFSYIKVLESKNYAQIGASMRILSGETEYVGAYLNSGLGYGSLVSITKNIIFDNSIEYSYTQVLHNGLELNYEIGVGYHSWRRELSSSQIEDYTWYSLRPKIGVLYRYKKFSIGANIEYQYGINPKMTILADSENPDTTVDLGSADIVEFSYPLKLRVHKRVSIFGEYVYQYQKIEKSNSAPYVFNGTATSIYEPHSEAHNQYLKFGAEFKF